MPVLPWRFSFKDKCVPSFQFNDWVWINTAESLCCNLTSGSDWTKQLRLLCCVNTFTPRKLFSSSLECLIRSKWEVSLAAMKQAVSCHWRWFPDGATVTFNDRWFRGRTAQEGRRPGGLKPKINFLKDSNNQFSATDNNSPDFSQESLILIQLYFVIFTNIVIIPWRCDYLMVWVGVWESGRSRSGRSRGARGWRRKGGRRRRAKRNY